MSESAQGIALCIRDLYPQDYDDEQCIVCYTPTRVLDLQCSICRVYVCKECLPQLQKPAECPHCRSHSIWQRLNAAGLRMHKMVISFLSECIMGTLEGAATGLPPMGRRRTSLTGEVISWRVTVCDGCGSVMDSICHCRVCDGCSAEDNSGAEFISWSSSGLYTPSLLVVEASTILESILTFIKGYHGVDNALQGASGLSSELALPEASDSCTTVDMVTSHCSRDTTRWSL